MENISDAEREEYIAWLRGRYEAIKKICECDSGFAYFQNWICPFNPTLFADIRERGEYVAIYVLIQDFVEKAHEVGMGYHPAFDYFLREYKTPVEAVLNGTWGK